MTARFVARPKRARPLRLVEPSRRVAEDGDDLLAAADREEPALYAAIVAAYVSLTTITIAEIEAFLDAGDVDGLSARLLASVDDLDLTASVARSLSRGAASAAKATVDTHTTGTTAQADAQRALDRRSRAIQGWAREHAANLVTSISEETRQAIRDVVTDALSQDVQHRIVAKTLRDIVGLTPKYAKAVARYEWDLLNRGVSESRARAQAKTYADRLTKARARTIARTEMMTAVHNGQQLAWQRLISDGILDPSRLLRKWVVTRDDRTCDRCVPLAGQTVGMSQPFLTDAGQQIGPPLHPNCRCTVVLVENASNLFYDPRQPRDDHGRFGHGATAGGLLTESSATDAEHAAIMAYSGNSYLGVNAALRGGGRLSGDDQAIVDGLDSAFERSVLPEDTIVYRGINRVFDDNDGDVALAHQWINEWTDVERQAKLDEWGGAPPLKDVALTDLFDQKTVDWMTPGTVVRDDAFVSTTKQRNTALEFGEQVVLRSTLKQGTPAIRTDHFRSSLPNGKPNMESEVLLPRGKPMRILGAKRETLNDAIWGHPTVWMIDVEFLDD